jgi:hypothetical protein
MVEQPQVGVRKHHSMLIRSSNAFLIHHAPAWGSQVRHTAPRSPMHVIREGEKGVARANDILEFLQPFFLF